jgi:hypothetical protein
MSDPIEAMRNAIANSQCEYDKGALSEWITDWEITEAAVAAYNALRETLVPVGWMYRRMTTAEADHIEFTRTQWAYVLTGWTETPLFALPEIEP